MERKINRLTSGNEVNNKLACCVQWTYRTCDTILARKVVGGYQINQHKKYSGLFKTVFSAEGCHRVTVIAFPKVLGYLTPDIKLSLRSRFLCTGGGVAGVGLGYAGSTVGSAVGTLRWRTAV